MILEKSYNMEYIYILSFKKIFKKFFKKKKKTKKVWFFLSKNYPLTRKSKNSRMGKGKGKLVRYCARIWKNHNIFEFSGFYIHDLFFLRKILKRKVNIGVNIYTNFFFKKQFCFKEKNENFFFQNFFKK